MVHKTKVKTLWANTERTNLKKLLSQQKHAIRIVNNKTRLEHTEKLFNSQKILNIYKLNILNIDCSCNIFRNFLKFLIRTQQVFQNFATRYLKQILLNVNTEFQAEC